jgi:hypothetical protein
MISPHFLPFFIYILLYVDKKLKWCLIISLLLYKFVLIDNKDANKPMFAQENNNAGGNRGAVSNCGAVIVVLGIMVRE